MAPYPFKHRYPRIKKTARQQFFDELDHLIPWNTFLTWIEPFYPRGTREHSSFSMETMLRIYFVQQWFEFSDSDIKNELLDSMSVGIFTDVDPRHVPDVSKIRAFRLFLERHGLAEKIMDACDALLDSQGKKIRVEHSTFPEIIPVPLPMGNAPRREDPEI